MSIGNQALKYDIILCDNVMIRIQRYRRHRIKSEVSMSDTLVSPKISKSCEPWDSGYQENFVSLVPGTVETKKVR